MNKKAKLLIVIISLVVVIALIAFLMIRYVLTEKHIVRFINDDGSVIKTAKVLKGKNAVPPNVETNGNKVFKNWDASYFNINSDKDIYAKCIDIKSPALVAENVFVDKRTKEEKVRILLLNNPGLSSLMFDVLFSENLEIKKVEFDDRFGDYITTKEPYETPLRVSMISPMKDTVESGLLATITFKIRTNVGKEPCTYENINLVINHENTFNENDEDVNFDIINSSLMIINN